jgi:hypothetical protein
VSTLATEAVTPLPVCVPEGASAHVAALPFGRFKVRVRDGLAAVSVGRASLQIEGDVVRLRARRPPRAAAVAHRVAPLGFVPVVLLFAAGLPSAAFLMACSTVVAVGVAGILEALLARAEETTVRAADTVVVAVRRPLGLNVIGLSAVAQVLERMLPRTLADLVGPRIVVLEAPFDADRLAIRRRAVVTRQVAASQSLVCSLRLAADPRPVRVRLS